MLLLQTPFLARWQVALLRLVIRGGGIRRIHVTSADGSQFTQMGAPFPDALPPGPPPLLVQLERAYHGPDAQKGR